MSTPQQAGPAPSLDPRRMMEFAEYIRDHPEESDATALGERFELPVAVVREALQVNRPKPSSPRVGAGPRLGFERIKGTVSRRPLLFIFVMAIVVSLPALLGLPARNYGPLYVVGVAIQAVATIVASWTQARLRFGLLASVVSVATYMTLLQVATLAHSRALSLEAVGRVAPLAGISILIFSLVLAVPTIGASLLGAMVRMRKEVLREQKADRLKLLEQVMQIQDRLESSSGPIEVKVSLRDRLAWARGHWYLIALGAGLIMFANSATIMSTVGFPDPRGNTPPAVFQLLASTLSLAIEVGLFLFVGFVSGSFLRGLVSAIAMTSISNLTWLLPLREEGTERLFEAWSRSPFVPVYLAATILVCGIAGMAAAVEERTYRKARIEAADQTALLAEMVRLQQILSQGAAKICVMAADVVGSTRMKQGEDALRVELSFRAFQDLVDRVVRAHTGRVFSTAGDGALAEFSRVDLGFEAAREIQRRLPEFNGRVNRLRTPFQVRIGLHYGEVHGQLERAEFTQVIDVAAHVEGAAPPGGIALTDTAVAHLDGVALQPLDRPVDGHSLFAWVEN